MRRNLIAFGLLIVLAGCGGGDNGNAPADDGCGADEGAEPTSSAAKDYTPDKGTATISGVVKFEGKPPKRRKIDMGAEKYCINCYAEGEPPKSETVIVGPDGGLKNVFVTVKYGLRGWKFPAAEGEVLIDQKHCMYVPHVVGVRTGQKIRIRNSDPILHNVHAMRGSKDQFNIGQTKQGQEDVESIKRAGMYTVKCEVHGWMKCYIGASKHPFFFVTGEDGKYSLPKLPAGEYTIEAWHEKYGSKQSKVTVGDGQTATLDFTFKK